ncbi:MAG: AAA family ATPase [Thermodesulfobacteriota bacterium]
MTDQSIRSSNPSYSDYLSEGFIPLLCKGYHPKYNQKKDYKIAKEPAFSGWNSSGYNPPSLEEISNWEKTGGWVGWRIPEGYIVIDNENKVGTILLNGIFERRGIEPPIHRTNKGHHDLFKIPDGVNLSAGSEVYTQCGLKVTYRVGGKNYLILAPTNGRFWTRWAPLEKLPVLPNDLLPYDRKNIDHVLRCLSWLVGTAYREGQFSGYENLDAAYMALLVSSKLLEEQIHRAFALVFWDKYDERRTDMMYHRTLQRLEAGEAIISIGSFMQRVKELGLPEIERFVRELQAVAGVKTYYGSPANCQEKSEHHFNLIWARDIVSTQEPEREWIWEGVLPAGGLSLVAAKPKVGKITLTLQLAVAVSRGAIFLGRKTRQATVVYLALEEHRDEVQKNLSKLGVTDEPLYIHFGPAPAKAMEEVEALIKEKGAKFLVIDILQKFCRVRDLNDYAQVTRTLEPLMAIARKIDCHIQLTHHAGKKERDDGDDIIGSTGLLGGVDTSIHIKKRNRESRVFFTIQRYGLDVPQTVIALKDGLLVMEGSREEVEIEETIPMILETLEDGLLTEKEAGERVERNRNLVSKSLRHMVERGTIKRTGSGKKGDPFRYEKNALLLYAPIYGKSNRESKSGDNVTKLQENISIDDFQKNQSSNREFSPQKQAEEDPKKRDEKDQKKGDEIDPTDFEVEGDLTEVRI